MPPPPSLMDDLVGEILLRFPPDEPELLVRATLVSKRWCRLISDPGFRRRFREFHRAPPPMLGCFYIRGSATDFAPASSIRLPHAVRGDWCAIDARHGLVLLYSEPPWTDVLLVSDLVVWDPVTGEQRMLLPPPSPPNHVFPFWCTWTAAVLCATAAGGGGCNNVDCHHGSFHVVFVCTGSRETFTCVYSSESGTWSGPTSAQLRNASVTMDCPSVLVGNALYYVSGNGTMSRKILKHDLSTQETSLISLPRTPYKHIVLTAMGACELGFAAVQKSKLFLWSREAGVKAYAGWTQSRVLELDTLLEPTLPDRCSMVCLVDGVTAVFKGADGIFVANLISRRVKKVCQGGCIFNIVPYTSFYIPGLRVASTGDGPGACASVA